MRMADSSALLGANPLELIWPALAALPQSSLVAIVALSDMRTSDIVGLASAPLTPKFASEGPMARMMTFCGPLPWTTKPPIITSKPVDTWPRVEMLASRGGIRGGVGNAKRPAPDAPRTPETTAAAARLEIAWHDAASLPGPSGT